MSRVHVVGSFITDLTVHTPHLPAPGETVIGESFDIFPGGKGFNQAVAVRRAGVETSMIGALGEDQFADLFWDVLNREGIDTAGVKSVAEAGTGVGIPTIDRSAQNSIVIVPRANNAITPADVRRALAALAPTDILLLQLEIPLEASMAAARVAADVGARVVLNPAPYQEIPAELLDAVDMLIPNEIELLGLVGETLPIEEAMRRTAADLDCDLVVTLGDQGVRILQRDSAEILQIPAHAVDAVDTVGAGDVFCGNLCAGLARGEALTAAAQRANAASALAVTRTGSALAAPTPEELDTFLSAARNS